jgi:hypothetical protein
LATICGYTYPQIDQMEMPQVEELFTYWQSHPPLHVLAAHYLGFEPPKSAEEQLAAGAMGPEDFMRFAAMTGGKIAGMTSGTPPR